MGIRVVPNETVPATVYKHLLPHERQVITVRFHPSVLLGPAAVVLVALAIAGLLTTTLARHSGTAILVIWLLWALVMIWFLFKFWEWLENYFVVTSKRLLLTRGVLTRRVNMVPLHKVTDMRFERSPAGRLLGYGKFIVEAPGTDEEFRKVDHLPYSEQLYLEVCGLIFQPEATPDK